MEIPRKRKFVPKFDGSTSDDETDDYQEAHEVQYSERSTGSKEFQDYEEDFFADIEPISNEKYRNLDEPSDSQDIRFLVFMAFVCREGASEGCIRRMFGMLTVVYGKPPPFSVDMVLKELTKAKDVWISNTVFLCGSCGKVKNTREERCGNCSLNSRKLLDSTSIVVLNGKLQIEQFIRKHGEDIVQTHKEIHINKGVFDVCDTRLYPGFRELMESPAEFHKGTINLIVTLSSDAARYKRLSRRDITPTFLRIENGCSSSKRGRKNLILLAMTYASGGVKKNCVDIFAERTLQQLEDFSVEQCVHGKKYTFKLEVMAYSADMKETQLLTGLPNWNEVQGCGICVTTGTKKRNGKVTFNKTDYCMQRADDDMLRCSEMGLRGYKERKIPIVYKYVRPSAFCIDPFHIRSAGICSQFVTEIFAPHKRTLCKLKPGQMDLIKRAIDHAETHTGDQVKLQNLRHRSKCTGREVEKQCVYLTALTSFTQSFVNSDFNVFALGVYYALTFLGSRHQYDKGAIRLLLEHLYNLHVFLEPESISIKWHCFYNHLLDHELKFGPVFTTEVFEREHRNLMTCVDQHTTNCEVVVPVRYITRQMLTNDLEKRLNEVGPHTGNMIKTVLDLSDLSEEAPSSQEIPYHVLLPEHRRLVSTITLDGRCRYLKRLSIANQFGSFFVSPSSYWKTNRTIQSKFSWLDPISNMFKYGESVLIYANDSGTFVLTKEYDLEPYQKTVERLTIGTLSNDSVKVLKYCASFPTTFAKVIARAKHCITVRSTSIYAPAVSVFYDNDEYIKMIL